MDNKRKPYVASTGLINKYKSELDYNSKVFALNLCVVSLKNRRLYD